MADHNDLDSGGTFRLTDQQRLAWLRLIRSENVGGATFRDLLNHFGSSQAALEALPELSRRGGSRRPIRICSEDEAQRELDAIAAAGARLCAMGEAGYPPLLVHVDAPPPLLTIIGDDPVMALPAIAIVGSRNCSISGRKFAAKVARDLGEAGYAIVSGLARGIDAAAHEASCATGTIAVLAGGIDYIYPAENEPLFRALLDAGGAVISEMPIGWQVRQRIFRAAIALFPAPHSVSLSSRRQHGRDPFTPRDSPMIRAGWSLPCRALRSIRARPVATS